MLIRVWTEDDGRSIRARLTQLDDGSTEEETVWLAGDAETVVSATRDWVATVTAALEAGGSRGRGQPT